MTMAPTPQGDVPLPVPEAPRGNEVVISGMAGLYPQARYVRDLENILYNKINPISSDGLRWVYNHPEAAQYTGNLPDLDRFDAQFFKVHYWLSNSMDPMSRKVLEQSYEAIYDAGINPEQLSDKKVGVYIGSCFSETEKACFYVPSSRTGLGIAGCSKAMFANRVSYWLNAKGPSLGIDDACCSSTAALEQAYLAISRGECEAAIVGGANLCLHPQSSVHYGRIMNLSRDGKTRSYHQEAGGCAKSEAINVVFLQNAKHALRIYAKVVNVQCEYVSMLDEETGPKYGFYRNPDDTAAFLKSFYDRTGVPPNVVEYVEGFGSAVPDVDKSELESFDKTFCVNRQNPLMLGSVMSNIGYGEAASGISAITKVLLGYHRGEIAGNLNCGTARSDVAAIREGRIEVLNDHRPFQRTFAAINSLSVTGVNAHVLLHGQHKPKDLNRYKTNIPYLVTISGRQDSSVTRALDELKSQPVDPEQLALLQNIHKDRIGGHLGRGYAVLDTKDGKTVCLSEEVDYYDDAKRPLWFVYSGMGSQWTGMGTELMRLPMFAAAIERCRKVLEPKGIDIVHIITSRDKTIFDNILHSFVGIAAVQIGLTDVLGELGLVPDNIIGHSVGELGCAYADGCLTAEEMILSAYSRGQVSLETPFIKGSMAAVGLGYQEMSKLCPPEIEIACHNSADSCTLSGPANIMQSFVGELVDKNIFAREVPCSNIAYHSKYIAKAGPGLLKYLKVVIKTPKARSAKWLSTSIPKDRWEEEVAKYSSAEYHTNNLLSPVLFEETSKLIPSNAVLVEIAPHGLLQAILKRSLPQTCTNIPLTRRGHPDNPRMVLEAVGKLYLQGFHPKVQVLYPKVEFPVSTGTPFLSNLVDWAHNEKWRLAVYVPPCRFFAASCKFVASIHDDEHSYLKGHVIRGKNRLPFSYALVAAWDTLAMSLKVPKRQFNVVFSDVHFHAEPFLHSQQSTKLVVSIQRGNGQFEITDDDYKIITGYINTNEKSVFKDNEKNSADDLLDLDSQDVYRLFYEREYSYSGQFRSIHNANALITEANIIWNGNWVTFIDGILQLNTLKHTHKTVSEPIHMRTMLIDVTEHQKFVTTMNNVDVVKAHVSDITNFTRCGGVLMANLLFHDLPPLKVKEVGLSSLKFVPRFHSNVDTLTSLQIFVQIVSENIDIDVIKVIGIDNKPKEIGLFSEMQKVAALKIPGIKMKYQRVNKNTSHSSKNIVKDADIVLVQNLSNDDEILRILRHSSRSNIFIINENCLNAHNEYNNTGGLKVVSVLSNKETNSRLELVRYLQTPKNVSPTSVIVRSEKDLHSLITVRSKLNSEKSLIILTTYPPIPGLKSLVKHWRKDSTRNNINLIMVSDVKDTKQLTKLPGDLVYNILDKGIWGGMYYMTVFDKPENVHGFILQNDITGSIDTLKWVEDLTHKDKGAIKVYYTGINVSDVQRPIRNIPAGNEDKGFGMEYSGVTESGERVMGLAEGTAQSHVIPRPELMWPVPSHWSLEDAATVPFAYLYAYYCIVIKLATRNFAMEMERTALIHGGAGALGQALISVCLGQGYEVFTTVSNVQKKKFLLRLFPKLKAEYIGNSRNSTFGDMVLDATNGKGCSLVFCCLKEDLKNISLKCTAISGQTMDIVQIQNNPIFYFGMFHLTCERTYTTVDISTILKNHKFEELKNVPKVSVLRNNFEKVAMYDDRSRINVAIDHDRCVARLKLGRPASGSAPPYVIGESQQLQLLVSAGIASGEVRPLSRVTYSPGEVTRAFRLLAASQHRGRVLLRIQDEQPPVQTRLVISDDGTHMILCDEQPLGVQLADMLISAGAKKIKLHFAKPSNYVLYKQRAWNKLNVEVLISSASLSDETNITNFLNKATSSGPIHGIYLAADYCQKNSMLTTIDMTVRKLCPYLRNFLMFSNGDDGAQFVAIRRAKENLPATVLDLSMLDTVKDEAGLIWYEGIKEAAEKALLCGCPLLLSLSQLKTRPKENLVQQIAGLLDMEIPDDNNNKTLEDFGIEKEKSETIASFLRDVHNVSMNPANVVSLSIERIKQIEERINGTKFHVIKGLGTFFSYVDPDEMSATTEMVFLPTLTNNSTMVDEFAALFRKRPASLMRRVRDSPNSYLCLIAERLDTDYHFMECWTREHRDDELDVSQQFLCIVPGLEGHHERFRSICERLKLPAVVLQPGLDHLHETVEQLALRYSQVLLKRTGVKNTFLLLGYETGTLVVLQLAAILENYGYNGTVFCIGDGPDETKSLMKEELLAYENKEELQIGLVKHMFTLMTGMDATTMKNIEDMSWKQRVDTCVQTLLGHVSHSAQYARSLLESAYARITTTIGYTPKLKPLRSKIVVLRALSPYSASTVPCTLQRFSQQPITVHNLTTPLAHVTRDTRCASLINKHLPEDVLNEFESKNICESYLLNAETFITNNK